MSTNTKTDLASILAQFSSAEIAEFVTKESKRIEAAAKANEVLQRKMFPADSLPEELNTLDLVREMFETFATNVSETIVLTPGNPEGGNQNVRSDRREIEVQTSVGRLSVKLYH